LTDCVALNSLARRKDAASWRDKELFAKKIMNKISILKMCHAKKDVRNLLLTYLSGMELRTMGDLALRKGLSTMK